MNIPHDRNAEEAVLGSLIIDPENYYQVAAVASPADFYIHRNRWIFEAIGKLVQSQIDVDIITITAEVDRRGEEWGGSGYLMSLMEKVPTSVNVVSYAKIVAEFATRRAIIEHANKSASLAYSGDPIETVLTNLQESASKATARAGGKRVSSKQAASKAIDVIIAHPRRFLFGVPNVDEQLKGIFPKRLYIWAGPQGVGKTAMMLQNARRNAEKGKKVALVTLEMSPEQVWIRMACGDLGVDFDSVMAGEVSADTKSEVVNKAGELGDYYEDAIILYPAPMTLMDIVAAGKVEKPDIMWIDHSRLITGKPAEMNGYEWAMHIPTFLRQNVAMPDDGISVHLLMQLNRSANTENRKPNMHDLRFGGEDDPDMVTLMHRPEPDKMDRLEVGQVKVELIHDKNRFGWTGTNEVIFDLPFQRFLPTTMFSPNQPKQAYKQSYAEV